MKKIWAFFALCSLAFCSCATPTPTPSQFFQYVADCGAQECRKSCPELAGPAVECLLSADVTGCLSTLVVPAIGITRDVVACVVRQLGSQSNARMLSDAGEPTDAKIAAAARAWISAEKVGYR